MGLQGTVPENKLGTRLKLFRGGESSTELLPRQDVDLVADIGHHHVEQAEERVRGQRLAAAKHERVVKPSIGD